MQAGKRRHLLTIESVTETQSSIGEPVESWGVFAQAWAAVLPLSGRELSDARAVEPRVTHRIETNYLPGLSPKMRGRWDDAGTERVLNFTSIIEVETRRWDVIIFAEEVA